MARYDPNERTCAAGCRTTSDKLGVERDLHQLDAAQFTPGKQSDLIIIDPNMLDFAPQLEQINQIVFNGQSDHVTWVFVASKPLKKNGQLVVWT